MSEKGLLNRIFNNLFYKVLSILLAFAFWFIVQGEQVLEIHRRIEVKIDVPEGYMIKGPTLRYKDVTLRGPRVILAEVPTRPLEANLKIPEKKPGVYSFRIDKRYIENMNDRIKFTVHDAFLDVVLDEKMTRIVPVKERIKGIPADNSLIEKITIQPSMVKITGLKGPVSRLKSILTESIDVSGIQKTTSLEVYLSQEQIPGAMFNVDKVMVHIQVGEQKINKRYTNVPLKVIGDGGYQVRPRFVAIVIQGTPGVLSFIKRRDLSAFIDIRNLAPGTYEKSIQVKIPADTVLIESVPEMATILVEPPT